MSNKYTNQHSHEIPPDDFSQEGASPEKTINYDDQWKDAPEPTETEKDKIEAKLAESATKTPSRGVSAPKQAIVEKPSDVAPEPPPEKKVLVTNKVGRKPTGCAMTNAQRQAKWRAANRDVALERQRAAMKKIRDAQKDIE